MNIIIKPKQEVIYANELQPGDIFEFNADKDQYYMRLDLTDTVVNLATGKNYGIYTKKSLY